MPAALAYYPDLVSDLRHATREPLQADGAQQDAPAMSAADVRTSALPAANVQRCAAQAVLRKCAPWPDHEQPATAAPGLDTEVAAEVSDILVDVLSLAHAKGHKGTSQAAAAAQLGMPAYAQPMCDESCRGNAA